MKIVNKGGIAALVIGLMALPVASQAAVKSSQVDASRVVITYSQEDLRSAEGRSSLEREIRSAASQVCGDVDYSKNRSLQAIADQRTCYHEAVSDALSDLSSGELQVTAR